MKQKQYNSVKVKDPSSDGYAIRLHPRQSFQLILTQIFEDEEFDIQLMSEYLVLEEYLHDKKNSKEIYCFSQNYDLERWSDISTVFLGNIVLTIKPKPEGKKETETIHMCVFLDCSNKEKAHVVTVINPDNHTLKIESNQIVNVVLTDIHYARWSLVGIEELGMDCAKSETVFADASNIYDSKALFCPEPRSLGMPINPALDNAHNTVAVSELHKTRSEREKEFHFWTHLNLAALKKAAASDNGNYPMGDMTFICKSDEGHIFEERKLTLMMALRGTGKRISTADFQAIRQNTRIWNTPYSSSTKRCVLSPLFNESVDLVSDADTLYIEIPAPAVYFNKPMDDAYWSSEINLDAKFGFKVQELTPRHVNGFMLQRFVVSGILTSAPPGDLLFIGALRFNCKGYANTIVTYSYKGISLSLWKVRGVIEDRRSATGTSYSTTNRTVYRKPQDNYDKYRMSHQQTVSFDVELEQMSADLGDGVKCVPLHSIDITRTIISSLVGYDFEDLMTPSESKKKTVFGLGSRTTRYQTGVLKAEGREAAEEAWQEREDMTGNWYNWFDLI